MTRSSEEIRAARDPLERALSYTSDYWIPINPTLAREVQRKLRHDEYATDTEALIEDLKCDIGLFTLCMRRLSQMLEFSETESPLEALRTNGVDALRTILLSDFQEFSPHDLSQGSDLQLERFQEMLISASTAETLSTHFAIDEDLAFSAAVLRQLGLALIAWNYPGVYEAAVSALNSSTTLESAIAERLGFSPTALAVRMVASWGLSGEHIRALGLVDEEFPVEDLDETEIVARPIAELCKIGEALARANDPDTYPQARDDWNLARAAITKHLGPAGLDYIREKFTDKIEFYYQIAPDIFSGGALESPDSEFEEYRSDRPRVKNPLLRYCRRPIRREIRKLYQQIADGTPTRELLQLLVEDLIPASDFTGGCVFTLDPGLMQLLPQLELGQMNLREFEPVEYAVSAAQKDPVALSYRAHDPIVQFQRNKDQAPATAIAGHFGVSARIGVLYLELPLENYGDREEEQLTHFKALVFTLNDILGLK